MAKYRELFNGESFDDLPHRVLTYSTTICGRVAYMLGEQTYFRVENMSDLVMITESVIFEYDVRSGKSNCFSVDVEAVETNEVLDFYLLDECRHAVLILYAAEQRCVVQHLLKFDRKRKRTECCLTRTTKFAGSNCTRVGLGASHLGYIIVTGITAAEEGCALVGMIIAADPRKCDQIRDIALDKELGEMERKLKEVNEQFFIWPRAIPMVTAKGIYFPVCTLHNEFLYFNPLTYASIAFEKNALVPKIEKLPPSSAVLKEVYNIEDANMMIQRGPCTWISFIQPGPADHWRWRVQYCASYACLLLLRYVGGFTLWLSRFDSGRSAVLFTRFYMWLVGPSLFPNWGPEPSFHAFVLNMKTWKYAKVDYKTDTNELKHNAQILLDVTAEGNATFFEINRHRMTRLGYYSNPFFPRSLFDLALDNAEMVNPALRTDPEVMKKHGVGHLNRLFLNQ